MGHLRKWLFHPAEWWQFWYPQSGLFGGLIIAYALILSLFVPEWIKCYGP
jgi:hypothetical protein